MGWEEKRQFKRAYIKVTVEYRGKNFWQMVEAKDISAGGIFVATDTVEPPDTAVEIMFEFGDEKGQKQFMHAEGTVAWSRPKETHDAEGNVLPAGMGIRFTKINPLSAKDFIDEIVKKLEENPDA